MTPPPAKVESVMDPVRESVARAYAEALLGHLPSDLEAEEVAAEMEALVKLLDETEGFERLLTSALLSEEERCGLVERIFRGRVSEPLDAALLVMAQAGRLGLLRVLRRAFRSALNRRQGKQEVVVMTAAPLDADQRERIARTLVESLKIQPVLTYQVDEDLLGGMVVRIGDRVYDASVRAELRSVRDRLRREIRLELPESGGAGPVRTDRSS